MKNFRIQSFVGVPKAVQETSSDSPRVGTSLFSLWNTYRVQVKAMADPRLINAINDAFETHVREQGTAQGFRLDPDFIKANSSKRTDPGVPREAVIEALREVKENMGKTGLVPEKQAEL